MVEFSLSLLLDEGFSCNDLKVVSSTMCLDEDTGSVSHLKKKAILVKREAKPNRHISLHDKNC
jgi:hypothetical protein